MEQETQPTTTQIDSLAKLYVDAQAKADEAQGIADVFGDQLITMTQDFGCIAPKADKTRQIQGETWIVKVTQGQSVQINTSQVVRLRRLLAIKGKSRIFGKLFATEQRYSLQKHAHEQVLRGLPSAFISKVRVLFSACIEIKPTSPRLKVDLIKKDKGVRR
jgi:hypothetical protein